MTARMILRHIPLLLGLLALFLGTTGCATRKVDWTARVGTYTFDQAVLELGPPAKQARLTDGTTVAEWMTQRGHTDAYYAPYYGYRYRYYGPVYSYPAVTTWPDVFLRLTFNPEGKLVAWKKVSL